MNKKMVLGKVSKGVSTALNIHCFIDNLCTVADLYTVNPYRHPDYMREYLEMIDTLAAVNEEEDEEEEDDEAVNKEETSEEEAEKGGTSEVSYADVDKEKIERGKMYLSELSDKYIEDSSVFVKEGEIFDKNWEQEEEINVPNLKDTWIGIVSKFNKKYNTKGGGNLKGTFTIPSVDFELRKIKEELVIRYSCARNLDLYKFAEEVKDFELAFRVIYNGSKLKKKKRKNPFSKLNKKEGAEDALSVDENFKKADS